MSFICYRRATADDHQRLDAAFGRFLARYPQAAAVDPVDLHCALADAVATGRDPSAARRLLRLWVACARRALRHSRADQIAYGSVGRSIYPGGNP